MSTFLVGLLVCFFFLTVLTLFFLLTCESWILRSYAYDRNWPIRHFETVRKQVEVSTATVRRIRILADPTPFALVAVSFGSRGSLLISQGLAANLTHEKLEKILSSVPKSAGLLRWTWRSWCWLLALMLVRLLPNEWFETAFGGKGPRKAAVSSGTKKNKKIRHYSPARTVWFWMLYPYFRFFFRQGCACIVYPFNIVEYSNVPRPSRAEVASLISGGRDRLVLSLLKGGT